MNEGIRNYIEHTNLHPTATSRDMEFLVEQAKEHQLFGVCVAPFWVKKVKRDLSESRIQLITVIGFPLGYSRTESKLLEIEQAIKDGVDELDMVLNISAFKSGMNWPKIEIAKCSQLAHAHQKLLKVIIETSYLSVSEIKEACQLCADAGADFVKTSTGFADNGASVDHIRTMRNELGQDVGIKASGGIRTRHQALALINAGADRIGTSSGVEIVMGV